MQHVNVELLEAPDHGRRRGGAADHHDHHAVDELVALARAVRPLIDWVYPDDGDEEGDDEEGAAPLPPASPYDLPGAVARFLDRARPSLLVVMETELWPNLFHHCRQRAVPLLLVNEPMYISSGENSDLRYNSFYPRWAYDQYRQLLGQKAQSEGWPYLDLWDQIAPEEFSDTPVHLTPEGSRRMAEMIAPVILDID